MTPFDVDEMAYCEIMDMYSEVRTLQIENKKASENTEKKIRRPAGDDWF